MLLATDRNADFWASVILNLAPPPNLSLYEWAEEKFYLSAESSAEPGKWHAFPYQKGIMDAYSNPEVEKITLMKSSRIGYTKILNIIVGYHVDKDPCNVLIVQPTVEDAEGHSKDELAPMIRDIPCLTGKIADSKTRDSNNTILKKSFPGGRLYLVGANSARGFRRISARVVLFDEVDGYPPSAGQEGDQIWLGTKRTECYWNRKIITGSTPTTKELSRVERSFNESDQRFYYVPCPTCKTFQTLEFGNLRWPEGEPQHARFKCIHEAEGVHFIEHSKKRDMVEGGDWRASADFYGHAGFFIWAAYSYAPNAAWGILAKDFLEAKKNRETLRTYKNTVLAQTWEEEGEQVEWSRLKARSEQYETLSVPVPETILTAGVDVQDDRLAIVVRAWGKGEESWLIFWGEVWGDPGRKEVWAHLDGILERGYQDKNGDQHHIVSAAVDSGGHHTQAVYNYARNRIPKVIAIKGNPNPGRAVIGKPTKQDVSFMGQAIKNGVQLWPVGSDTAKGVIFGRLRLTEPGPGYYHFPIGLEDDYFLQLTAEKLTIRYVKGFPKSEWVKVRKRNEAIDCETYCYAAALRAGLAVIDFDKTSGASNGAKKEQKQKKATKPKKGGRW